jgi:hypothetical protein
VRSAVFKKSVASPSCSRSSVTPPTDISRGMVVAAVVAVVVVVVLLESMSVVDCAVTNASASANKLPNKRLIVQKIDSFQIDLILNFDYRFYFDCRLLLIVVFGFCAYLLLRFD